MKDSRKECDSITKMRGDSLVDNTIESLAQERYNSHPLGKGGVKEVSVEIPGKRKGNKDLKNSLLVIKALYAKGIINTNTMLKIEKKYGGMQ